MSTYPDPDPDHLIGRPNLGYNTNCVKIKSIGAIIFELLDRTDRHRMRQTDRHTKMYYPRTPLREQSVSNYAAKLYNIRVPESAVLCCNNRD